MTTRTWQFILAFAVAFILVPAAGCGDDGGTCPTNTIRIAPGQLELSSSMGTLLQGAPSDGTLDVDREAETVTLTYTNEAGESVVEVYRITATSDPGAQDPPAFPGS